MGFGDNDRQVGCSFLQLTPMRKLLERLDTLEEGLGDMTAGSTGMRPSFILYSVSDSTGDPLLLLGPLRIPLSYELLFPTPSSDTHQHPGSRRWFLALFD